MVETNFKAIAGALSIYREGDVIAFDLNGIEFSAPIQCVEMDEGRPILWVTPSVGVYPNHVKRVRRKAS